MYPTPRTSSPSVRAQLAATIAMGLLAACGGPVELAETQSAASSGTCSNICTNVVACCVCHCHQSNSWPFNYACDAGCLVLDTTIGESEAELFFVDPAGDVPANQQYVVQRTRRLSFEAVAMNSKGQFQPVEGLQVELGIISLDDYLSADARGLAPRYAYAGRATGRADMVRASLDLSGYRAGPYILKMSDGRREALGMVEVR